MDSRRSSGTMRKLSLENPRRRVSPHPGASPVIHRYSIFNLVYVNLWRRISSNPGTMVQLYTGTV